VTGGETLFGDAGELLGPAPGAPRWEELPACESCGGTGKDAAAVSAWHAGTPTPRRPRVELLNVFVPGNPTTAGSVKAFVNPKQPGRAIVVKDNGKNQAKWRADVQNVVREAWGLMDERPPVDAVCSIHLEFVMPRPLSMPKSRTKPHGARPDADKLIRAVQDALTHVVWTDDARADKGSWYKRYAEVGETAGCRIRILTEEPM